ncbi:MAG: hypothetical protein EA350_07465 [Gemmatimonadales bacterium]|nr:MAG: hypothetical protein EA350_07465 [Gemmatimonadales bacterium]
MKLRGRIGPLATALAVALLAGAAAASLSGQEPRGGGWRLLSGPEIWLMAVFVAAVLALLFGASAWMGVAFRGGGAREALEALRARADEMDRGRSEGGASGAVAAEPGSPAGGRGSGAGRRDGGGAGSGPAERAGNSPAWIMEVGGWLILLYVAGWLALG